MTDECAPWPVDPTPLRLAQEMVAIMIFTNLMRICYPSVIEFAHCATSYQACFLLNLNVFIIPRPHTQLTPYKCKPFAISCPAFYIAFPICFPRLAPRPLSCAVVPFHIHIIVYCCVHEHAVITTHSISTRYVQQHMYASSPVPPVYVCPTYMYNSKRVV